MLQEYKKEFIQFLLDSGALKFGDFTLKSGRKSPFFMNIGCLNDGPQLLTLSSAYADTIHDRYGEGRMTSDENPPFSVLFGPAYKGIPLAVATAMQLECKYGLSVRFCANRKEAKDHGEKSAFLGAEIKSGDRILMIEDVTTSGASMEETIPAINEYVAAKNLKDVRIVGLLVAFNRLEYAPDDESHTALSAISKKYGMPAWHIVSMEDVCEYLATENPLAGHLVSSINDYYRQYAPLSKRGEDMYHV